MSSNVDTFRFDVRPRDVGADKRMHLYDLGSCVLDAAGLAAKRRGFGMDAMHERHRAWVVSRMMMSVAELPREYDFVDVSTWVSEVGNAASTRLFEIRDGRGEVVCRASTLWSIIDTEKRSLCDLIETTDLSAFVAKRDDIEPIAKPRKILIPAAECVGVRRHEVVYSDIDMNRHVTSMKYLQWCMDMLPYEVLNCGSVGVCNINFLHEVLPNDVVDIRHYVQEGADGVHLYDVMNGDVVCCRIKLQITGA